VNSENPDPLPITEQENLNTSNLSSLPSREIVRVMNDEDALVASAIDLVLSEVTLAVEEIVRWTTPVNYMKRTVVDDVELRGQKIRAGEELMLCYASANRDEEVFDDPFAFRIERSPNRHLGFGIGEHFCLGAHLARRSQAALFGEIARRVERLELAGEPQRTASSFVAGIKHLPVRYRFAKSR